MSKLTEPPKNEVCIDGENYPVNADFRNVLKILELLEDESAESTIKALIMFYNVLPTDIVSAVEAFIEFFGGDGKSDDVEVMSFEQDGSYIYSAFIQQYGIDLHNVEFLHWDDFCTLLESVKDTRLNDIIELRTMKIPKNLKGAERTSLIAAKNRVALKKKERKPSAVEDVLLHGGDLQEAIWKDKQKEAL